MSNKLILSTILGLTLLCQSTDSYSVNWPVIDSDIQTHDPVIKKFIENAKNERSTFQYIGHQFKVRGGNNYAIDQNYDLFNHIDTLENAYLKGYHIEIKPTSEEEIYKNFEERCKYKIIITNRDDVTFIEGFRVYAADSDIAQPQPIVADQLPSVDAPLIEGWYNRPLGRGAPTNVDHNVVKGLLNTYKNHNILKHAFNHIKAADLADIQDPILFADYIQKHGQVSANDVINAMNEDKALLQRVKNLGVISEGHEERGLDFGNQLSYPTEYMSDAINLIRNHPSLLRGKLDDALKSSKGGDAHALLQAQFYIAAVQSSQNGYKQQFSTLLSKIGGLFHKNLPSKENARNILKQTHLCVDGVLYTPAHNYVKHGDVVKKIKQQIANLPNNMQAPGVYENIFTDCSGLSIMVLRKLFPDNDWIQNERAMSWHFAAAYDYLNNENAGYDYCYINGNKLRVGGDYYKDNCNMGIAKKLAKMLKPVNYYANRKAGDILVQRHTNGSEGHVMTIVDPFPNPHNSNEVIIAEMTRCSGNYHGLVFRKMWFKEPGNSRLRILRPISN
ncbi:MAG: hypothetical protein Q8L85_04125 [Alphaproteobacteria bacterium]|nr:hypothetical protein [Alphaproteobacteria bacterium]